MERGETKKSFELTKPEWHDDAADKPEMEETDTSDDEADFKAPSALN